MGRGLTTRVSLECNPGSLSPLERNLRSGQKPRWGLFGPAVTQAQPLAFPCNSNGRLAFLSQHKRKPEFPVVIWETRRNSRKITWFPVLQDEALAPYSVSREVSHSVLKCKTVLGTLDVTPKVPLYTDLTRGDTEVPGTTSSEAFLLSWSR